MVSLELFTKVPTLELFPEVPTLSITPTVKPTVILLVLDQVPSWGSLPHFCRASNFCLSKLFFYYLLKFFSNDTNINR